MQDRFAGDIGDYVKIALLRALSVGRKLGIIWYAYPNESHNNDGNRISYLEQHCEWRDLDPKLYDHLQTVARNNRRITALFPCLDNDAVHYDTVIRAGELPHKDRSSAREEWFAAALTAVASCDLVFADPDNGLCHITGKRRHEKDFGKKISLEEAKRIAANGRLTVIYHHNSRFAGGHDEEVDFWLRELGSNAIAVRAKAYSPRTFFILNPDPKAKQQLAEFAERWKNHKVSLHFHPDTEEEVSLILETLTVLQADIDDESPQVLAAVIQRCLDSGALDAHLTPIVMKKNRPGVRLEVLCRPEDAEALVRLVLVETSTIGVKARTVERYSLPREFKKIEIFGEQIDVKLASLDGKPLRATPEFEQCRALAEKLEKPVREVLELARAKARQLLS